MKCFEVRIDRVKLLLVNLSLEIFLVGKLAHLLHTVPIIKLQKLVFPTFLTNLIPIGDLVLLSKDNYILLRYLAETVEINVGNEVFRSG